uniref:Uncharacterized protein n=1 Tax=Ciona intestinalis TaxID=7719 RepID=F6Q339_CIOIN
INEFGYRHCPGDQKNLLSPDEICNGVERCKPNFSPTGKNTRVRTWTDFSADEQFCPTRALCEKSRPRQLEKVSIHISQICDDRIDCVEEEDESEDKCGNQDLARFYCETRAPKEGAAFSSITSLHDPMFVPHRLVLDGKKDCYDGSDECPTNWFNDNNFSSRFRLIEASVLSILIWMMSVLAIGGNLIVITLTLCTLWKSRRY